MRLPKTKHGPIWRRVLLGAAGVAVLVGLVAFGAWYKLFREEPQHFASAEEAFKYGSTGIEAIEGLPYPLWRVLPSLFPEYLPGPDGYASLGFAYEAGRETPVGLSIKTVGFPRIAINCAFCHTGTYRTAPDQPRVVVPTAPTSRFDVQGYLRFLFAAASDPRFTPDTILPAVQSDTPLNWLDQALYRYLIIPRVREELLKQKERYAWTDSRPDWGRGRIDPFNPVKFN